MNKIDIRNYRIKKVICGGGNGSILVLDLVKKDHLLVLFIYCSWRLELNDKTLTTSNDDYENRNSIYTESLVKLETKSIETFSLNNFGDLILEFESGYTLRVFADIFSKEDNTNLDENWCICDTLKNKCLLFNSNFEYQTTSYK